MGGGGGSEFGAFYFTKRLYIFRFFISFLDWKNMIFLFICFHSKNQMFWKKERLCMQNGFFISQTKNEVKIFLINDIFIFLDPLF